MLDHNHNDPDHTATTGTPLAWNGRARGSCEVSGLLAAVRGGDDRAWRTLVTRFDHVPHGVARSFRLTADDADDIAQATWMLLFERIDQIREPAAIGGWLATTARRQALRMLQGPVREILTDDPRLGDGADTVEFDDDLLSTERRAALSRALATLPERYRRLMKLIVHESAPDYREISVTLSLPVGSIGAMRARALTRLERHPDLQRLQIAS